MFINRILGKIMWILLFLLLTPIGGCLTHSGSVDVDWGKNAEHKSPPSSQNKNTHYEAKKNGPPAHAPANGYRAKHMYRYYPDESVYFDTGRGVYFYIDSGNWSMSVSLPGSIRLGSEFVSLEMETDKPYAAYGDHKKKYPPGKTKNMNKKKKHI